MHPPLKPSLAVVTLAALLAPASCAFAQSPVFSGGEPAGAKSAPLIPRHERPEVTPATASAVTGANRFGFDLFRGLRSESDDPNAMLSPLSVVTAFGMTYAGAAGGTAAQMEEVFGFGDDTPAGLGALIADLNTTREGRELRVVNRLFAQDGMAFEEDFLTTNRDVYGAPVERTDYLRSPEPSRRRINDWVEGETNDRIQNLMPEGSVNSTTRLVLTNAVYFDGDWKHRFDERFTAPADFHLADGSTQSAPTMRQTNHFRYGEFDGYQMLEMPYAGDDLSMVIVLPEAVDGLAALEAQYTADRFAADVDSLAWRQTNVALPRFKFRDSEKLNDPLRTLGLADAFEDNADFSRMAQESLSIDSVIHKSFIDVTESGTEAAAATGISIGVTSGSFNPPPVSFSADHPFLFAIRDTHTDAVMFLGRMGDPEAALAAANELSVPEPSAVRLLLAGCLVGLKLRPGGEIGSKS